MDSTSEPYGTRKHPSVESQVRLCSTPWEINDYGITHSRTFPGLTQPFDEALR